MDIDLSWANQEKTALLFTTTGDWNWEEFLEAMQRAHTLMDEVAHPVDWVVHNQDGRMPNNWVAYGRRLAKMNHANTNRMVFVGASSFIQTAFSVFERITPNLGQRVRFVETMDEAYAWLSGDLPAK